MMELDLIAQPLLLFLCYVVRLVVMFRVMPVMGTNLIPQQSLVALAAILLLPIIYGLSDTTPSQIQLDLHLVFLLLKEVFLGMLLGLIFSLLFWIAQSVGFLIDNQRGASQAENNDPFSGDKLSPYASLIFQAVAMLFFSSGFFFTLLDIIYESYRVWPVFAFTPQLLSSEMLYFLIHKAGEYMGIVVSFAGPILIICFLSDFCLGIVNRFAQQLNVFSLSMPIKSALALFVLALYAQGMFTEINSYIIHIRQTFDALLGITSKP